MRMIPGVTDWNSRNRQHNGGGRATPRNCCHHELAQRARDLHFQFIRNYQDSVSSLDWHGVPVLRSNGRDVSRLNGIQA